MSFRKSFSILAVVALVVAAFAQVALAGNNGPGTETCQGSTCLPSGTTGGTTTITNTNTATGGAGGQGSAGGTATAIGGGATIHNTNVNTNFNDNKNTNTNTIKNSNTQGQAQNNKQTIAPAQSTSVGGDTYNEERQAPPAFAPGLVAAPETCMGAVAVGASSPFGGVSFGTTYKSEDCELRMYARSLMALGNQYAPAAVALLAQNPNVAKALKTARLAIPGVASVEVPVTPTSSENFLGKNPSEAVVSGNTDPSSNETEVTCSDISTKIRAGNGEYFCRTQ